MGPDELDDPPPHPPGPEEVGVAAVTQPPEIGAGLPEAPPEERALAFGPPALGVVGVEAGRFAEGGVARGDHDAPVPFMISRARASAAVLPLARSTMNWWSASSLSTGAAARWSSAYILPVKCLTILSHVCALG